MLAQQTNQEKIDGFASASMDQIIAGKKTLTDLFIGVFNSSNTAAVSPPIAESLINKYFTALFAKTENSIDAYVASKTSELIYLSHFIAQVVMPVRRDGRRYFDSLPKLLQAQITALADKLKSLQLDPKEALLVVCKKVPNHEPAHDDKEVAALQWANESIASEGSDEQKKISEFWRNTFRLMNFAEHPQSRSATQWHERAYHRILAVVDPKRRAHIADSLM